MLCFLPDADADAGDADVCILHHQMNALKRVSYLSDHEYYQETMSLVDQAKALLKEKKKAEKIAAKPTR